MQNIHIIADSPCDITPGDAELHGIEILPIMITYGGVSRREFYDIDVRQYWKDLEALDEIPTTAQITPLTFIDAFKRAAERGVTHIIVITLSATASGTYTSASVARDLYLAEYGGLLTISVVDSRGYSMVYGQTARKAAMMRNAGASYAEIVDTCLDMSRHMEALFLVYSLKHMRKSGRINGGMAFVGEAIGLRPIARVFDGYIDVISKARGDRNVVIKAVDLMHEYIDKEAEQDITIVHSDVPENEILLAERLVAETFRPRLIERVPLGCSVSTNTGPHMLGIIYRGRMVKWPSRL